VVGGLFVVDGPESFVDHLLGQPGWSEFDHETNKPKSKQVGGVPPVSKKKARKAAPAEEALEAAEE